MRDGVKASALGLLRIKIDPSPTKLAPPSVESTWKLRFAVMRSLR